MAGTTIFSAEDSPAQYERDIHTKRLHFGLVFQNFNLFPQYTALQNITLARELLAKEHGGESHASIEAAGRALLEQMGLADRADHYPYQLSGGQQQRVAIARAISTHPPIIMADEPTGALDSRTGHEVLGFLQQLNKEGSTVILITHDNGIAATARRIVRIADGKIIEDHPQEVDWY